MLLGGTVLLVIASGCTVQEFIHGYRDGDGPPEYEYHFVHDVIPCEYGGGDFTRGWRPYDHANPSYYSRAQFHPDSWARAGGGDYYDDYTVGLNVARWARRTTPGNQWPVCWWR